MDDREQRRTHTQATGDSLGIVQRVDFGIRAVALHLRAPGSSFVVVVANARGLVDGSANLTGAAILDAEARSSWPSARLPLPAISEQARARTLLVGGHLIALTPTLAIVSQASQAKAIAMFVLAPEGAGPTARVRMRVAEERDLLLLSREPADKALLESRREAGQALGPMLTTWAAAGARMDVHLAISRALSRLDKRATAVRGDLSRIGDADRLASQASWLVAEASRTPRGRARLEVTDWSTGEPVPIVVPLDPAKSAREQVEAMFHRARRLKKGAAIATMRLTETEAQIEKLRAIATEIDAPDADLAAVVRLAERARSAAPRDVKLDITREGAAQPLVKRGRSAQEALPPYRTFVREDGTRILVGRGAEKNDRLTFQVARPHDLWLHAKGRTGAHVIVPLVKATNVTGDLLADAALLAAHFSDARDEAIVDVEYTARKYLKKPRGGAAGRVVIEREKVLALRMNDARRKILLEREEV